MTASSGVRVALVRDIDRAEATTLDGRVPGGDDEHHAVAYYGTDPGNLRETVKSHIRLNRNHPDTIFRVRLVD